MHCSSWNMKDWIRKGLDWLAMLILAAFFFGLVGFLVYFFVNALLHERAIQFTVAFVLVMSWACWRVANTEIDDRYF